METVRLTTAQAFVRFLVAQRCEVDGSVAPLFPGVFAIFGHGNVTALGEALEAAGDTLPTWRGQNEQGMAMAAIGFAKAVRRRQVMIATSSIGPGALNMVTAAGIAMANRLPVLLISGDTFANRLPDPVLQQVERFDDPTVSVNDAFKPVVRYWDRIGHPAQILQSLPQAVAVLLDPAECGPVFLGLPQDVQAEAYDYPLHFFAERVHRIRRPRPDPAESRSPSRSSVRRNARWSSPGAACAIPAPRGSSAPSPKTTGCRWRRPSPAREASPGITRPMSDRSGSPVRPVPTRSPPMPTW